MSTVLAFQAVQLIIIAAFVVFASDFRRKKGMRPMMDRRLTAAMKCIYPVPIALYAFSVWTIEGIGFFDAVALSLTILGTVIVVKAKADLGFRHTWAGYIKDDTTVMKKGIYSLVRHPIYTGVYVFVVGAGLTLMGHAPWYFAAVAIPCILAIVAFLTYAASRETDFLIETKGDEYKDYSEQVHAFLPIRKYKEQS